MKRRPGEQAAEGETQISEEQLREERAAEVRRSNENRNQSQLDRRNAIADQVDDIVHADLDDIDGDRIIPRDEDDTEAAASAEERRTARERERLEAAADANEEGDEQRDRDARGEERGPPDEKLINGVLHYLTVVNGKEKWLTLKQLRETSSKVEAADEYLQQAAESARRAVALRTSEAEETEEADTELEETLNKALLGDQESVKKLARHLKASPSRVTPDVMQAVDERLTFRDAVNWFEGEYKDELKDPRLKDMIVRADVRLRDENPEMGYRARLKKAGDEVRQWRNDLLGASNRTSDGTQRPNKQQRKQQMTPVVGAGGRQAMREDEDAEETVSDQIQAIARGRLQANAIKH